MAATVLPALVVLVLAMRATGPDVPGSTAPARTETGGDSVPGSTAAEPTETGSTEADPVPTGTTTASAPAPPFAIQPTRRCLRLAGAAVSPIRSTDPRLRALGDLAQRTSFEVRLEGRTLGLAFGDTRLLEGLLRVPDDPYRLEVRRNALLMYRPAARDQAAVVRGCLLP